MAQTDYTSYRLFNIPSDVDILVDGIAAVENVWYANILDITANKKNIDDYGEPFAVLEYQTTDGEVGCDRKDNKKEHSKENVVPACYSCNITNTETKTQNFKLFLIKI